MKIYNQQPTCRRFTLTIEFSFLNSNLTVIERRKKNEFFCMNQLVWIMSSFVAQNWNALSRLLFAHCHTRNINQIPTLVTIRNALDAGAEIFSKWSLITFQLHRDNLCFFLGCWCYCCWFLLIETIIPFKKVSHFLLKHTQIFWCILFFILV